MDDDRQFTVSVLGAIYASGGLAGLGAIDRGVDTPNGYRLVSWRSPERSACSDATSGLGGSDLG